MWHLEHAKLSKAPAGESTQGSWPSLTSANLPMEIYYIEYLATLTMVVLFLVNKVSGSSYFKLF